MVAITSVWSMEIVEFVTAPEFTQHSGLLAWIVAGTGLIGLGQILTIKGFAMRRPSAYIGSKAVAAIALLGAAYFGATRRGAEGVAMALVAAGSVYLVSVLYVNARLVRHESL
jgi:O-antigen/teichoic acid export membrane protein